MNLEEGFRRMGIVVHVVALMTAIGALFLSQNPLFTAVSWLSVYIVFHLAMYVARGFVMPKRKANEKQDRK